MRLAKIGLSHSIASESSEYFSDTNFHDYHELRIIFIVQLVSFENLGVQQITTQFGIFCY